MSEPSAADMARFVHTVWHLDARRGRAGYPESALVNECWSYPCAEPPGWAYAKAAAGEPARDWCPIVNPSLAADGGAES